jgi:hypothetical protein
MRPIRAEQKAAHPGFERGHHAAPGVGVTRCAKRTTCAGHAVPPADPFQAMARFDVHGRHALEPRGWKSEPSPSYCTIDVARAAEEPSLPRPEFGFPVASRSGAASPTVARDV